MKTTLLFSAVSLVAISLLAADTADEVKAAAKKLSSKDNYSWTTTIKIPEGSGGNFRPGPTDGKTEKDGYTIITTTRGDNTIVAVLKGGNGAAKYEGEWKTLDEWAEQGQTAQFIARRLKSFKAPAVEAQDISGQVKELKKESDLYSGDLTEEGAKQLLSFRGGQASSAKDAKGTAKFWIKDGQLSKYEYHVEGTMNFNGEDRDIDRTTTTEIKEVGNTKVEVPDGAKKKLS